MNAEGMARLHAIIEGRVQGVGYRAFVVQKAQELGLKGWARNRWNGSVEVLAEGKRQSLENLLAALREGPRLAHVTNVQVEWGEATGEFNYFYVRSTA